MNWYRVAVLASLAVAVWLLGRVLYPPKKQTKVCCLCDKGFVKGDIVVQLDLRALPAGEDFGPVHWRCAADVTREAGVPFRFGVSPKKKGSS